MNDADAIPQPRRRWAWKVCLVLTFATLLSYLDRQSLSVLAPRVRAELHLDNASLGGLLSAFYFSFAFMNLFVGWFLDKPNIRVVYGGFVGLWSLAQILAGAVRGVASLIGARMLLGIFEAAAQPGAARIIARIVPPKDRTLANGVMMSGGSLGSMIAGPLLIPLSAHLGWRGAFAVLGCVGLVWTVFWLHWFRPPGDLDAGSHPRQHSQEKWSVVLRDPRFRACAGGALFTIPIIHVLMSWIPTYMIQTWKLPLGSGLGVYLLVIYMGMDVGYLLSGIAVKALVRRGATVEGARKTAMLASTGLMLLAAVVPFAPSLPIAVALMAVLQVGRASWGANFLSFNQDIAAGRVGAIAGIMACIGALSASGLVWAIGYLSKAAGFKIPFLIIAVLAVLGMASMMSARFESRSQPR